VRRRWRRFGRRRRGRRCAVRSWGRSHATIRSRSCGRRRAIRSRGCRRRRAIGCRWRRRVGRRSHCRINRRFRRLHLRGVVPVSSARQNDDRDKEKQTSSIHSSLHNMAVLVAIDPLAARLFSTWGPLYPTNGCVVQPSKQRVAPPHVLARLALDIKEFLTVQQGREGPVSWRLSAAGQAYCTSLNRAEMRDFVVAPPKQQQLCWTAI